MIAGRGSRTPFPAGAQIFQRMYTRLGCASRPPHFHVEFFPYASLSHTIRMRGDTAFARLSDLLRGAPLPVLESIAALLLARIYRRPLPAELRAEYSHFANSSETRRKIRTMRSRRGRRMHTGPCGEFHDLDEIFARVNAEYFAQRLARTSIGWSTHAWRRQLGVFDPGLGHIVINRRLDRENVPGMVVAYVVFHEMLHLMQSTARSRCGLGAHSPEFRRLEKRFREYEEAHRFLTRL